MHIDKGTVEGFAVKRDDSGPYVDIKLRARPTTEELGELYHLMLAGNLALEVDITSRQEAFI